MTPRTGETWFVDFGMTSKPRWAFVVGHAQGAKLAVASVVKITTEYARTPYGSRIAARALVAGTKLRQCAKRPARELFRINQEGSWPI